MILEKLIETNLEQTVGYGEDPYCEHARELIRKAAQAPEADVHFLVGGTQTNFTVISAVLRPHQGVLSAGTGHINVHETGAVEATGHKVLALPSDDGKIRACQVRKAYEDHWNDADHEHVVQPGMVYISHPTENGTLYTKEELRQISEVCRDYEIPLYLDGARLGYGLMSRGTDLSLCDIAEFCDAFYIGGTKVGALCGEAVVFPRKAPKHFLTAVKQHGALLAKGRLLGIQFDTLFTDDLYFRISSHAIEMAEKLKKALREKGLSFAWESPTNQQFVVMEDEKMKQLRENVVFSFWEKADRDHTIVRFATSWGTKEEEIEELKRLL